MNRLLAGVIAAVALALAFAYAEDRRRERAEPRPRATLDDETIRQRQAEWLRVGRSRRIGEDETLTELLLLDPYLDELNVTCLLYRGPGGAAMACPDGLVSGE